MTPIAVFRAGDDFGAYVIAFAAEDLGAELITIVREEVALPSWWARLLGATSERWHVYIRTKGVSRSDIETRIDDLSRRLADRRESYYH